jgi:hypothetical protein
METDKNRAGNVAATNVYKVEQPSDVCRGS